MTPKVESGNNIMLLCEKNIYIFFKRYAFPKYVREMKKVDRCILAVRPKSEKVISSFRTIK